MFSPLRCGFLRIMQCFVFPRTTCSPLMRFYGSRVPLAKWFFTDYVFCSIDSFHEINFAVFFLSSPTLALESELICYPVRARNHDNLILRPSMLGCRIYTFSFGNTSSVQGGVFYHRVACRWRGLEDGRAMALQNTWALQLRCRLESSLSRFNTLPGLVDYFYLRLLSGSYAASMCFLPSHCEHTWNITSSYTSRQCNLACACYADGTSWHALCTRESCVCIKVKYCSTTWTYVARRRYVTRISCKVVQVYCWFVVG
jgi:hypothetical protein